MKPLTIADSPTIILGLQDEIRRSEESRYDHRLHGVLLVAQGMTCPEVARLLGDAPRSVEYWVGRFEKDGLAGLSEGERPGRPRRLTEKQWGGGGSNFALSAEEGWSEREPLGWKNTPYLD